MIGKILPPGYRFRARFVGFLPLCTPAKIYWLETIRIVQRYEGPIDEDGYRYLASYGSQWHDVGLWDEVATSLTKDVSGIDQEWTS